MLALSRWIGITSMLCAATGCVQQSYRVERVEAERLADLPPEKRGERVRGAQGSAYSADPSHGAEADGSDPARIVIALNEAEARILAAAVVQAGRSTKNDSRDSGDNDNDGAGSAAIALLVGAALATTAVISVGVAEGVRHDGWLRLEPDAILLHIDREGERTWLTLDKLTPDLAASADQLLVYDFLDKAEKLERAPLNRVGFSYDVQMGVAGVNTTGGPRFPGFGWRGVLGYFPWQIAGFGVGLQFSYGRQVPSGESVADDALSYRVFGEFEAFPLAWRRLHLGPYAFAGYGHSMHDTSAGTENAGGFAGGGGLSFEVAWTTRLAVNLRSGVGVMPTLEAGGNGSFIVLPEVLLGVSVY